MRPFKTLDDLDVTGKRVLVRADLNLPMADGRVTDATRIERLLPTLRALIARGARVVLLSHFGRPKGQVVPGMSLRPVLEPLAAALGRPVAFADDCIGPAAERVVGGLADGEVALLENLRFHPGEEANDPGFAQALAGLGEVYVNDAFSAAHRAHASTTALARLMPAAAGRGMQAELEHLESALERPARPVAAIIGGAKVTCWRSAAAWRTLSCMPSVTRSGARSASVTWPTRRGRSSIGRNRRPATSCCRPTPW
jgi:phosphoglycerate kinase